MFVFNSFLAIEHFILDEIGNSFNKCDFLMFRIEYTHTHIHILYVGAYL